MELKELTSAFAAKMGIDGLTVEDGVCALEIDGIPLQIAETAVGGALLATAVVGLPPPEKTEAFLDLLLEANTETFGPQDRALGKIHDTGEVVLQWRIPTRDVELDGFCAELEAFWRWRTSAPPRKRPPPATRRPPPWACPPPASSAYSGYAALATFCNLSEIRV